MLSSLCTDSSWTRKRSSSCCKAKPSFREHSCFIRTLRIRCCKSIYRRRCSLSATDVSDARDCRLANSSANLSRVPWCRRVSFSCYTYIFQLFVLREYMHTHIFMCKPVDANGEQGHQIQLVVWVWSYRDRDFLIELVSKCEHQSQLEGMLDIRAIVLAMVELEEHMKRLQVR